MTIFCAGVSLTNNGLRVSGLYFAPTPVSALGIRRLASGVWRLASGVWRLASGVSASLALSSRPPISSRTSEMFWKRNRVVRVELTTPISLVETPPGPPPKHEVKPTVNLAKRIDADLTFKFATFFTVVLQAVLIVWGYLELAAYYEQFGIGTSELELGTPTLLVYGYSYTFSELMSTVDRVPVLGAFIPAVIFIGIGAAVTFLFFAMHDARSVWGLIQRSMLIGLVLLLIFLAPTLAVWNGIERAEKIYETETGLKAGYGLSREHTIVTDQKEILTGRLIVADTKSTYIQIKDAVYKIDNSSNRVMRKTLLKPAIKSPSTKSAGDAGPSATKQT